MSFVWREKMYFFFICRLCLYPYSISICYIWCFSLCTVCACDDNGNYIRKPLSSFMRNFNIFFVASIYPALIREAQHWNSIVAKNELTELLRVYIISNDLRFENHFTNSTSSNIRDYATIHVIYVAFVILQCYLKMECAYMSNNGQMKIQEKTTMTKSSG